MAEFFYTCLGCGIVVTVKYRSAALSRKYCGQPCHYRSQRKERTENGYRQRYVPSDHPLSNGRRYILEHRAVLWDRIGPGPHQCYHCSRPVDWRSGRGQPQTWSGTLVVDHLDRDPTNNDPANIAPSCHYCNIRNADRIVEDDELFVDAQGARRRAVLHVCAQCSGEFLAAKKDERKYCSWDCYSEARRRR